MKEQSLMDLFSNPETCHSLSMGEKLLGSTVTMLMGIGITFMVLCLLWAFIALMGKVMGAAEKKGTKAPAGAAAATPSPAAAPAQVAAASDDAVIAAVIAAAVAAYEGEGASGRLVVRKISRISGETTLWTNAAREDCIDSRKF